MYVKRSMSLCSVYGLVSLYVVSVYVFVSGCSLDVCESLVVCMSGFGLN